MQTVTVIAACAANGATDLPIWKFVIVRQSGELVDMNIYEHELMERVPDMDAEQVAYVVLTKVWPEYQGRIHGGSLKFMREPTSSAYAYVVEIDIED